MRAWKESSNGSYTYYIYDGTDTIAELSGTGTLNVYYTVGGNGLVSKRAGSISSFYTYDPGGSVSTVTNGAGALQGDEAFDATGMRVNGYTSRPVDFCGQWRYHFDDETGLLLCGHRYYDPYTARFLNRDPIGYTGGINLYSYVTNNFVDQTDMLGYTGSYPIGTIVDHCKKQLDTDLHNAYEKAIHAKDKVYSDCMRDMQGQINFCKTLSIQGGREMCLQIAINDERTLCPDSGVDAFWGVYYPRYVAAYRRYDVCAGKPLNYCPSPGDPLNPNF